MDSKICLKCNSNSYFCKGICGKCYMKEYSRKNRERLINYQKDYYEKNKKRLKIYRQQKNIKIRLERYNKEWCKKNQDIIRIKRRGYNKKRKEKDINYRLRTILRGRLGVVLNYLEMNKQLSTIELLGCTIEEFKIYLEKQFTKGMNWQNMGKNGWVIDHIKSCCSFDLTKLEEQKKCFHYNNLRPLWEQDNQKKIVEDRKLSIRNHNV